MRYTEWIGLQEILGGRHWYRRIYFKITFFGFLK